MDQINVRLQDDLLEDLRRYCAQRGISQSVVIRRALAAALYDTEFDLPPPLQPRVAGTAGKVSKRVSK